MYYWYFEGSLHIYLRTLLFKVPLSEMMALSLRLKYDYFQLLLNLYVT